MTSKSTDEPTRKHLEKVTKNSHVVEILDYNSRIFYENLQVVPEAGLLLEQVTIFSQVHIIFNSTVKF